MGATENAKNDPAGDPTVSVLTIVRGRRQHLLRQARGLLASSVQPSEWVIVSMGEDPLTKGDLGIPAGYPLRTDRVDGERTLPLAQARNRAASIATGSVLLFLDVDCIPGADCLAELVAAAGDGGLWMGDIRYLPKDEPAGEDWSESDLDAVGIAHPLLPDIGHGERVTRPHEMFWSLCFAVSRESWALIGGFDESLRGYGAEDTDVAFAARARGLPFGNVGARAYHQHHTVCKPPLNHVEDLVANATRFHEKWGVWPMDKWLGQLDEAGYVRFDPKANVCEVARLPTDEEIAAAQVDTPAGF